MGMPIRQNSTILFSGFPLAKGLLRSIGITATSQFLTILDHVLVLKGWKIICLLIFLSEDLISFCPRNLKYLDAVGSVITFSTIGHKSLNSSITSARIARWEILDGNPSQ